MSIKKINGYRIFMDQSLGKGAYGKVYRAENSQTKEICAVKILDKSCINSDPYLKAALISQIKVMKSVHSENIVALHDVMESSNNYYIIQEICDTDLEHYLKTKPGAILDQPDAIKLLTEMCNGFLSLAKEGIVHRDLKPANILLSKGVCKIADFGFAKKNQKGMKIVSAVGTPLYMSIEVLKGQPYTSKCDIWAMGFIFYEVLHGRTPWTARSQYELIKNIETKPLKISEKLSPVVIDFLQKCLKIYEEDRISWEGIFRHPIFGDFFNKQLESTTNFENVFKKVLTDIRFQVNSKNLHLKKLWGNLGYEMDKQLNQEEFRQFMNCVVPNLAPAEEQYFFNQMDVNKDGAVSLKQLEIQFQKHDIPLTSQFEDNIPFLLKKMVSIEDDDDEASPFNFLKGQTSQIEMKIKKVFEKLDQALTKKNITLYKVFSAYDGDKNGKLEINQFGKIMKRLDPQISEEQIKVIFDLVDTDQSKTVEFDEFSSYFCKINGLPESIHGNPSSFVKKK